MNRMDFLSKYQNYIIVMAIILMSIAISIRSIDGEVRLVLGEYPVVIFALIMISALLVIIYFEINKRKMIILSNQIKELSEKDTDEQTELLKGLTERQKEVYDLIMNGKTNKEIMSELFIEQSTLKTHINQIYKKLNIKSRRQLKYNTID